MIIKKLLFLAFAGFLTFQSVQLMSQLIGAEPSALSNGEQVFAGVILGVFITGIFAFPGFVFPTHRFLPKSYYSIKNPQVLKNAYRWLGVKVFTGMLLIFFWGWKKNRKKYFDGTRSGIPNLIYQSKQSEFGHMGAFVVLLILSVVLLFEGYGLVFGVVSGINIIGNAYPVILQRHHRMRIEKILQAS